MATAAAKLKMLVVGATGGLGQCLVREALSRGHIVSVLARDRAKLVSILGDATVGRLANIHVGDAKNPIIAGAAVTGQDIVFGAQGADAEFARVVAEQTKAAGAKKFVFVAGATNVLEEDGVTPAYIRWKEMWKPAESAFHAHGACIDAIRKTGVPFVIFCPAMMDSLGLKSPGLPEVANIRVNRPSGPFVSFEDAAWVMLEAAEGSQWDGELVTASTKRT
jgi:uncharacterized protein YbjT (DUF2867 family)